MKIQMFQTTLLVLEKKLIIAVVCFVLLCVLVYIQHSNKEKFIVPKFNYVKKIKYILFWTSATHFHTPALGFDNFKECEFKDCFLTDNRSLIPVEEFDAIIFNGLYYNPQVDGIPRIRKPNQRYIYWRMEAPTFSRESKVNKLFFNWTLSYRFDSDIVKPHGYVIQKQNNYEMPDMNLINNKTRLAAWFVSHCNTSAKREILVKKLQKFVNIDVYGRCGPYYCPKKTKTAHVSSPQCYDMIEKKYKFYLSFENSYCKDYITEKLYNILQKNIIPVAYGGGDYMKLAPPYSTIIVDNFKSAEELASYLVYLDKNSQEYLKYFKWKKSYIVKTLSSTCNLCKKLHTAKDSKIYIDTHKWFWGDKNETCKRDKDLPNIIFD